MPRLALDSTNPGAIITALKASAVRLADVIAIGYHNGPRSQWPASGFTALERMGVATARIDVLGNAWDECSIVDFEQYDVQNPDTLRNWVRNRNKFRNDAVVYCNISSLKTVFSILAQDHFYLWLAHPTGTPAIDFPVALPANCKPWGHQFAWPPKSGGAWDLSVIYADDWHIGLATNRAHAVVAEAAAAVAAIADDPAAAAVAALGDLVGAPSPAGPDPTAAATAAPAAPTPGPAESAGTPSPTSPTSSTETGAVSSGAGSAPADVSRETSPAMPAAAATVDPAGSRPAAAAAAPLDPAAAAAPAPTLPEQIIGDLHTELTRAAGILPGLLKDIGLASHSTQIQLILNAALEGVRLAGGMAGIAL